MSDEAASIAAQEGFREPYIWPKPKLRGLWGGGEGYNGISCLNWAIEEYRDPYLNTAL